MKDMSRSYRVCDSRERDSLLRARPPRSEPALQAVWLPRPLLSVNFQGLFAEPSGGRLWHFFCHDYSSGLVLMVWGSTHIGQLT